MYSTCRLLGMAVKTKKRVLDWPRAGIPNVFIDTIKLIILINLNVMFFIMRSNELAF